MSNLNVSSQNKSQHASLDVNLPALESVISDYITNPETSKRFTAIRVSVLEKSPEYLRFHMGILQGMRDRADNPSEMLRWVASSLAMAVLIGYEAAKQEQAALELEKLLGTRHDAAEEIPTCPDAGISPESLNSAIAEFYSGEETQVWEAFDGIAAVVEQLPVEQLNRLCGGVAGKFGCVEDLRGTVAGMLAIAHVAGRQVV